MYSGLQRIEIILLVVDLLIYLKLEMECLICVYLPLVCCCRVTSAFLGACVDGEQDNDAGISGGEFARRVSRASFQ